VVRLTSGMQGAVATIAPRAEVREPAPGVPVPVPSVVVVDEQPLFRAGLVAILRDGGLDVVGEADDLHDARAVLRVLAPDVVLVALDRWRDRLSELVRAVSAGAAARAVVGVVGAVDDGLVVTALAAGVCGCVLRGSSARDHVLVVRAASRGERFLADGVTVARGPGAGWPGSVARLSPRELDVLRLLARGWDNASIAHALFLSRATVKHHVSALLRDLGVDNRVQAAVRAVELGLLD
jgi:DNA-binding NarL/FixJ family response regulator